MMKRLLTLMVLVAGMWAAGVAQTAQKYDDYYYRRATLFDALPITGSAY